MDEPWSELHCRRLIREAKLIVKHAKPDYVEEKLVFMVPARLWWRFCGAHDREDVRDRSGNDAIYLQEDESDG